MMRDSQCPPICGDLVASRHVIKLLIEPESGRLLDASQAAADFYGQSREALRQGFAWDLASLPERTATLAMLAELAAGRDLRPRFGLHHRRGDGEARDVLLCPDRIEQDRRALILATVIDVTEQRQEEARLRANAEQFRALVETTSDCLWEIDTLARFTYLSPRVEDLTGYPPAHYLGRTPAAFELDTGGVLPVMALVARFLLHGRIAGYQVPVRHRDGRRVVVEVAGVPIRGPTGLYQGWRGVTRDVTERVLRDEALAEARVSAARQASEQRLGALVDQELAGVAETDLEGRLTHANDRFCQLLGQPREGLLGRPIQDLMVPEDRPASRVLIEHLRAGGSPGLFEERYRRADGALVYGLVSVAVIRDVAGDPTGLFGLVIDITARREAEERLRQSEARWKGALDGAGHAVWDWNVATGAVDFSPAWKRALGYDETAFGGQLSDWVGIVHPDDLPAVRAAVRAHLAGATPGYECVHRVRCRDGRWRWVLDRGAVFARDAAGEPLRMLGTHTDITAWKEAEAALREAQYRLAEAQRIAHLGSFEYDAATRQILWSDEEYRIYGLAPAGPSPVYEDLLTRHIHPEDAALLEQIFGAAVASRSVYELEHRIIRPDGGVRWVYNLAHPYCDASGALVRYIGSSLDITERKHRELDLRRYRQIVEVSTEKLLFIDPDLHYRVVNPAYAAMFGRIPAELQGRSIAEIQPPGLWMQIRPHLERVLSGASERFQIEARYPDGQTRCVEAEVSPFWEGGEVQGIVASLHDLTDMRAAQGALEAERAHLEARVAERTAQLQAVAERLDLAAEAGGIGVWEWDMRSGAIAWDTRLRRLYGLADRDGDPPYATWMDWIMPEDRAGIEASVAAVLRGEEDLFQASFRVRTPDGRQPHLASRGRLLCDADGPARMLGVNWDISALKEAQEAAEAAARAKSEFLAHMSHEIRTPLNSVLGLAQVLEHTALDADQRLMLGQIRAAGGTLLDIVNDILDLAKIEAGRLSLEARPFTLAPLLGESENLFSPLACAKGLALTITPPALPVGWLRGDPVRVRQVLVNLIGNAIKFTERGEVRVQVGPLELGETRARLRFEVRDTGIGLAPQALAGLFTPFTQADGSITRRFGGTGLGLAICKRLVALMDGVIGAESREGQGSRFWFELSFERVPEALAMPPIPRRDPAPSGRRLAGVRVLVVDDSTTNRSVAERMLALEGARATLVEDGRQAIERLRGEPRGFDAVLMDVQMPDLDGLTATRLIRSELGLTELPIIALTAGVLKTQQEAALAAGMNDVLTKPLELERMVALLSQWVRPGHAVPAAPDARAGSAPLPKQAGAGALGQGCDGDITG